MAEAIRVAMYVGCPPGFKLGGAVKQGENNMEYYTDSDHAGDTGLNMKSHWLVAWSTTQASMGFGVTSENHPSVTPRFVALVLLILKLCLSLPSLPRAMRNLNKTARGLYSTPSSWAFRQELPGGNLPGAAPRSKASSALILKLL